MRMVHLALAGALAAGCTGPTESPSEEPLPFSEISIEPGPWYDLAWPVDGRIIVAGESSPWRPALLSVDPHDGAGQTMAVPESDCQALRILRLGALQQGELGLADTCWDDSLQDEPYRTTLLALEAAGTSRFLGAISGTMAPVTFAWNGSLKSLVYEIDGSLCSTLYRYTPEGGARPLDASVVVVGHVVELGENLDANGDRCTRTGRAGRPDYGPDGETLALVASPAQGRVGQDRIDLPWALVILKADGAASAILEGLREPQGLAWSSSDELLVSGTLDGRPGVWRVPVNGGAPARAAPESLGALVASPDGRAFAGFPIRTPSDGGPTLEQSRILIYQLGA